MKLSVLVVDDDPAFLAVARRILAAGGLAVVGEAGTAQAASEIADELRPAALLVDVGLPDEDGVALAVRLVALPWRPSVLLMSSDPDLVGPEELLRSGAVGFLFKQDLPDAPLERLFLTR
jgi:DNA-binding NarL/FixJ family response regulator